MKILIVDDHALFVEGMHLMLQSTLEDARFAEAGSAEEALACLRSDADVDLIIMDFDLGDGDAIAVMQALQDEHLTIPVAIVSASVDPALIARALDAGAVGYIPKHSPPDVLLSALRQILDGNMYLSAELAREVSSWRRTQNARRNQPPEVTLSPRQQDVLRLMQQGLANRDIGDALHLSEATVKTHVAALLRATDTTNRTACVAEATRRGWLG